MTAGRGGGGWRDTQSSTTFRDRKRTHTMVRVQGGLYGEGRRKDFRTSGGVLWPKTRNEQSDRSREIGDSSGHHHTPPTAGSSPFPPITRETVRSGSGPCTSTSSISTTRTTESRRRLRLKSCLSDSSSYTSKEQASSKYGHTRPVGRQNPGQACKRKTEASVGKIRAENQILSGQVRDRVKGIQRGISCKSPLRREGTPF